MFGIGGFELFIILLFGFLIFGPDKLPEMAKTLGSALRKFKQAQAEMESVIKGEVLDVDGSQSKKASPAAKAKPAPTATQESFAQRKARYDKERAERQERERVEANRSAMKQQAAQKSSGKSEGKPAPSGVKGTPQRDTANDSIDSMTGVQHKGTTSSHGSSGEHSGQPGESASSSQQAEAAESTSQRANSSAPLLTPDELFGNKPIQRKPAPQSAAAQSGPQSSQSASKVGE